MFNVCESEKYRLTPMFNKQWISQSYHNSDYQLEEWLSQTPQLSISKSKQAEIKWIQDFGNEVKTYEELFKR